jgi:hypothetical protein
MKNVQISAITRMVVRYGAIAVVITSVLIGVSFYTTLGITGNGHHTSTSDSLSTGSIVSSSTESGSSTFRNTGSSSSSSSSTTTTATARSSTSSISTRTGSSTSYQSEALSLRSTLGFSDNQFAYDSSNGYMYGIDTNPLGSQGNISADYTVSVLSDTGLVANLTTPCVSCFYRLSTVSGGLVTSSQTDYLLQATYSPVTNLVYAFELYQNLKNGTVDTFMHVINTSTNSVAANYEYKQISQDGVASDTTNSNIYVYTLGNGSPKLLVLNGGTGAIEDTISNGLVSRRGGGAIVFDPLNSNLYTSDGQIVNTKDFSVTNITGIAGQTDLDLATINLANNFVYYGWTSIVYCCTPLNAAIQLVNASSDSVVSYDLNVQNSSGSFDTGIVYDSQSGNIYVSSQAVNGTDVVSVVSYGTSSVLQSITSGTNNVQVLAYDPSYNLFYGLDGSGSVVIATIQ